MHVKRHTFKNQTFITLPFETQSEFNHYSSFKRDENFEKRSKCAMVMNTRKYTFQFIVYVGMDLVQNVCQNKPVIIHCLHWIKTRYYIIFNIDNF